MLRYQVFYLDENLSECIAEMSPEYLPEFSMGRTILETVGFDDGEPENEAELEKMMDYDKSRHRCE